MDISDASLRTDNNNHTFDSAITISTTRPTTILVNPGSAPSTDDSVIENSVDDDEDDASVELGLTSEPSTVLVIFDKSGSMDSYWDEDSKWVAASNALIDAIKPLQENLTVGAIFFPQPSECLVAELDSELQLDFMPGPIFINTWIESASANAPNGSTPLETALAVADRAISKARERGLLEERFQVLLLTDGEPNCDTDPNTLDRLPASWLAQGIQTYVLGLPGSSVAAELLDTIAKAGGTETHTAPGNPGELQNNIAAILM